MRVKGIKNSWDFSCDVVEALAAGPSWRVLASFGHGRTIPLTAVLWKRGGSRLADKEGPQGAPNPSFFQKLRPRGVCLCVAIC